jgi:hypothetical protein
MKLLFPLVMLGVTTVLYTPVFPQAMEGKIEYQKGDKIAATLELPYSPDIVEEAIKGIMDKKGIRTDRSKGFDIFRNARLKEGDPEISDLHFKVERKSRKEKEAAVIYLLIGRPSENVAVRISDDKYKLQEAKEFLNRISPSISAYNMDLEIRNQESIVMKEEGRLQNLQEDQKDIERKIKNLQEKLEANKNEQRKQTEEAVKQKAMLAGMQGKRRGM